MQPKATWSCDCGQVEAVDLDTMKAHLVEAHGISEFQGIVIPLVRLPGEESVYDIYSWEVGDVILQQAILIESGTAPLEGSA